MRIARCGINFDGSGGGFWKSRSGGSSGLYVSMQTFLNSSLKQVGILFYKKKYKLLFWTDLFIFDWLHKIFRNHPLIAKELCHIIP